MRPTNRSIWWRLICKPNSRQSRVKRSACSSIIWSCSKKIKKKLSRKLVQNRKIITNQKSIKVMQTSQIQPKWCSNRRYLTPMWSSFCSKSAIKLRLSFGISPRLEIMLTMSWYRMISQKLKSNFPNATNWSCVWMTFKVPCLHLQKSHRIRLRSTSKKLLWLIISRSILSWSWCRKLKRKKSWKIVKLTRKPEDRWRSWWNKKYLASNSFWKTKKKIWSW